MGDKNTIVMNFGYMCFNIHEDTDDYYVVGTLSEVFIVPTGYIYILDVSKDMLDDLIKYHDFDDIDPLLITAFDLDYGLRQIHDRMPFFITMRTLHPDRQNIQELAQAVGMDYYSPFEYMLRKEGKSLDEWIILRDLDKHNIINKERFHQVVREGKYTLPKIHKNSVNHKNNRKR